MTDPLRPADWGEGRPWTLSEIDHETQRFCLEMHKNGIYVDQAARERLERSITDRYRQREKILVNIMESMGVGRSFIDAIVKDEAPDEDDVESAEDSKCKPGSYDQIRDLLYGPKDSGGWDLGIPPGMEEKDFLTTSGLPGTGDKVLRAHLANEWVTGAQREFIEQLRLYRREKNKIVGTTLIPMSRRDEHARGLVWEDDRVRSTFNSHVVANTRLSSSRPNCFTGDTEILTTEGWVRFDQLEQGLPVAQWDDGVISFVEPLGYVSHFSTDVMRFSTDLQVDIAATADHRCLVQQRKTGVMKVVPLTDLPTDHKIYHAGISDGPYTDLSDDLLRLVVAAQADGSYCRHQAIKFCFKKQRKIDRLTEILRRLGVEPEWKTYANSNPQVLVTGELCAQIKRLLDAKKRFQPWVLALSRHSLDVFVEEVMLWDGCSTRMNHYASEHKVNADIVQAAYLLSGRRARVRKYVNSLGSVSWQVDVSKHDYSMTTNGSFEQLPAQQVYCVEVPSSFVLVRRNDRAVVVGNCQNLGSRKGGFVKKIFTAAPGHILVGADLAQAHLYIIANYWGIKALSRALEEGLDPHVLLAADVAARAGEDYGKMAGWEKVGGYHPARKPAKNSAAHSLRELCKTVRYTGAYGAGVNLRGGGLIRFSPTTIAAVIRSTEEAVYDDAGNDTGGVKLPYLKFTDAQATNFHNVWMESEPDWIQSWEWEMRRFADRGYATDPIFQRRSGGLSGGKFNEVVNYPILTAEAHIMRLAEWATRQAFPFEFAGKGTGVILQVHDSLIVEIPLPKGFDPLWAPTKDMKAGKEPLPPELEKARRTLEECMSVKIPGWPLAIKADAAVGRTLADV